MRERQHEATERQQADNINALRIANAEQADEILRLKDKCATLKAERDLAINRLARVNG